MNGLRVLVCGGRDFDDAPGLYRCLSRLHGERPFGLVITGGAKGADSMASAWAFCTCVDEDRHFADWKAHGRAAGPIRNQLMLDEGKPDLVVAFPGRGTADMVRRARAAGVEVLEVGRVS